MSTRFFRQFLGCAMPLALGLTLAGCMSSMNDLSRDPKFQPAVATVPVPPGQAGLTPAVLTGPAALPPAAPKAGSEKKPLKPDERAKAIAELEALAAKQGAPAIADEGAADACTEAAARALDPEAKLQRERQGLKC